MRENARNEKWNVKLHASLILAVNSETTLRDCLRNLSSFLKSSSRICGVTCCGPLGIFQMIVWQHDDNDIIQVCRSFIHSSTEPQSELLITPVSCFREFHRDYHRAIPSGSKVSSRHVNCLIVIVSLLLNNFSKQRWCYHSMSIIFVRRKIK